MEAPLFSASSPLQMVQEVTNPSADTTRTDRERRHNPRCGLYQRCSQCAYSISPEVRRGAGTVWSL